MQSYSLVQVAPPSVEPVSLLEAKVHLRVDNTAEDALIQGWIQAARQHIEGFTGRALLPQDWELRLSDFPCLGWIELPSPPLISVLSLTTYSTAGVPTVLDPAAYQVEAPSGDACPPARLYSGAGVGWPVVGASEIRGAVRIRYRAGYASPGSVPQPLRAAILLIVGELYANREAASTLTILDNPAVGRLLRAYRILGL